MDSKMASCLVLAVSTLVIAASAATTSSNNIGTEGLGECFGALTNLKPCSDFFTKGKFEVTRECCEAIATVVRDCLSSELRQFGIINEHINILAGFCRSVHGGAPTATPLPAPTAV